MHREVFAGRDAVPLTVGEMPGVTVDQARAVHRPGARPRSTWSSSSSTSRWTRAAGKWDVAPVPAARPQDVVRPLAGRAGADGLEQPVLEQPRPAADRVALGRRRGVPGAVGDDARDGAALPPRHARTSTRARSSACATCRSRSIADFRDIESLNHYAAAVARGEDPEHVLAAMRMMGRDNARTPVQWDASPNAGLHHRDAVDRRSTPTTSQINAAAQVDDPGSVFSHYRRLIALRHDEPAVAHGDFTMLLPDDESVYAFTRASTPTTRATSSCWCWATSPATTSVSTSTRVGPARARAGQLSGRRCRRGHAATVGGARAPPVSPVPGRVSGKPLSGRDASGKWLSRHVGARQAIAAGVSSGTLSAASRRRAPPSGAGRPGAAAG